MVLYNFGLCLGDLERYQEAVVYFDRAIAVDPRYEAAWAYKGDSLNALGRHPEAIQCFEKAIEINPDYAKPYYFKAYALVNSKRKGEARLWFQRYLEIAPSSQTSEIQDAQRMLRILGAIVK
jgi:tetratricopeptide (TPR) repeat protein